MEISSILTTVKKLDDIWYRASKYNKIDDEYKKLGEYVAATLRKLPLEIAAEADIGILQVLHALKIKALRPVDCVSSTRCTANSSSSLSPEHCSCSAPSHSLSSQA